MEGKSKEIMKRYVAACDRYTQEKADNAVNSRVGSLNTFNQCTELRSELLKAILKENGYGERKIY